MSSVGFLVTELQSLASETRRKHPEIREAAEKALAIIRASPEQATATLASDGPQSDDLLRPVFMGCATKNAKVVAMSLGSLQRLISLKAVPRSAVPRLVGTMNDAMSQGVDIQLRILQTLVSLVPNFPDVHGSLLGEALLLCFKLQESRIAVVSSTAAATLRQLVMFVVDKMDVEDRVSEEANMQDSQLTEVQLPDGSVKKLGPSALDAFCVFEDLCLLANSEKPHFLKLEFLHKTFALELIESVLTNYHQLFRKHEEHILLLSHHLCPLLLKSLSDRPQFSLSLRCTRVVFLLLKQFSMELQAESEVFLMLLIRIISDEGFVEGSEHHSSVSRPHWMRVLAMEVMRGLCTDAELIRNLWDRYDAQEQAPKVISSLITSLKRLVSEKPALLGQNSQMWGLGVHAETTSGAATAAAYGLDMAGRVASATVSGVAGIIGVGGIGLSIHTSAMKLQCIDQLDKADAPPIPESYVYLLTLQCIVSLCEGFASFSGPIYTSLVQRPRTAGEPSIRAPPALDVDSLPQDDAQIQHLHIIRSIISQSWPALLAALSFIISTNLSDELFVEVLASYQAMANVSGMLGLSTPRDAFFNSLSKFAVPTPVVSSLEAWVENPPVMTPRSTTSAITEGLGLSGPTQPPALSERNLACLKVFIGCAVFLAGSLGESWYAVLDALQSADGVLVLMSRTGAPIKKGLFGGGTAPVSASCVQSRSASLATSQLQAANAGHTNGGMSYKHPLLSDLEVETVLTAIQRLFDSSKNLDDSAFKDFVNALCKLSAEMVGMRASDLAIQVDQSDAEESGGSLLGVPVNQSQENVVQRRRVSGIYIPKNVEKSGDFGITKLGGAALLNIHRLIYRSPDIAWNSITSHLLMVIRQSYAPQTTRIQAGRLLDEILLVIPRNLSNVGDLQAEVQIRVLDILSQQVILDSSPTAHQPTSTSVELRRMGLETLHQILQAVGHTIVAGWELIFRMLESVCRPLSNAGITAIVPSRSTSTDSLSPSSSTLASAKAKLAPLQIGSGNPSEKSYSALVKIAFQSLTLVCDSVSSLSPEHLRLCIGTLGQFGRQADTNIALTATASLLWSVSDAIQSKRKNLEEEPEYSGLWMLLLLELLGLCTDPRAEVRDGAIQTLFRTVQLYGATLNSETWDQCIWTIIFPLLTELTAEIRKLADSDTVREEQDMIHAWDESKILALASIGSIFSDFLVSKIMLLDSYTKAWDVFVRHVEETVLLDNRIITPHVLRCLERGVKASAIAEGVSKVRVMESLERVWQAIDSLGKSTLADHAAAMQSLPLTQEALIAFVDVTQCVRSTSKGIDGKEWDLPKLTRLMVILKGILTYSSSSDYRPDIDALSPLQATVLNTVGDIDLTIPGSPSLVMRDLSQYITLAYLAAFDVQSQTKGRVPQTPQKRVTYIAVSKKTMPLLVDLFMRFKSNLDIYTDGTVESAISAYLIPINMKYDCPAPSRFGKDVPLWKTATNCFLPIVKQCSNHIKNFGSQIPPERLEGIWKQILDVFRGSILADCSVTATLQLDEQEADENFDFAVIASLENDVVPYLGDPRLSDEVVMKLGQTLQRGSMVYDLEDMVLSTSASSMSTLPASDSRELGSVSSLVESVNIDTQYSELGSTHPGKTVPRERYSYWCLNLLFSVCSEEHKDQESWRMRLAALSLPSLLNRCRATLLAFVADEYLRGSMPFPRAREEELLYILNKLLELRLWPGSLWAALSDNPSQYCTRQPVLGTDMAIPQTTKELFADTVKRSSVGHLFHFYPLLCELASIPHPSPSYQLVQTGIRGSVSSRGKSVKGEENNQNPGVVGSSAVVERDARHLSIECLKKIGKEMGLSS